jgi:predicted O-methyltransferase YrrM
MKQVKIRPTLINARMYSVYLGPYETSLLVHLVKEVKPKVMIEFGCNLGITAKRVLENVPTLERYIGIDVPSDHIPTLSCQFSEIPANAGVCAAEDHRFMILLRSSAMLKASNLEHCDAVFIDGDHSREAVLYETLMAREIVRPGGIVVWHDYGNDAVEVTDVLDKLYESGWPIRSIDGSWLAFMKT